MKHTIIIISLIILVGCVNKSKTDKQIIIQPTDSLSNAEIILYELFPVILDSIYYGQYKYPQMWLDDTIATSPSFDSVFLKGYRNDTNQVVLAINDTLTSYDINKEISDSHIIDITKLKAPKKFLFKYYTTFPQDLDIWSTEYDFNFQGIIELSHISLNYKEKKGSISWGFTKGGLNGSGGEIILVFENNKWKINRITELWVS